MTGSLFIVVTNSFMGNFFGSLTVFQLERPIFLREQANQMYGFLPYFLTKTMIEQPILFISPLIYELVIFWGVGYWPTLETFLGMYCTIVMIS